MPFNDPDDLDVPQHHALHTLVLVRHVLDPKNAKRSSQCPSSSIKYESVTCMMRKITWTDGCGERRELCRAPRAPLVPPGADEWELVRAAGPVRRRGLLRRLEGKELAADRRRRLGESWRG